mmetsp:Transcript_25019/g.99470  ORF Transcript_25019/g.99470 Transcript_25019/m.99470 type:complete len:226 (+) Transcript_25019:395-1072(+)
MKQQRAVLLAACEAQAAHAQCADFAGELMRAQMEQQSASGSPPQPRRRQRPTGSAADPPVTTVPGDDAAAAAAAAASTGRAPVDPALHDEVVDKLQRLEHENQELLRKTAVLVDYVRATAPMPRSSGPSMRDDDDDEYSDDDDDDFDGAGAAGGDDKDLPPRRRVSGFSCLPEPTAFDHFASKRVRECKWDAFVSGVLSAFGSASHVGAGRSGGGGAPAGADDDD